MNESIVPRIADDETTAELLELARKVWGDKAFGINTRGGIDVLEENGGLLAGFSEHPRADKALKCALLVLADDSVFERYVALNFELTLKLTTLVEKLERLSASWTEHGVDKVDADVGASAALLDCADELNAVIGAVKAEQAAERAS